MGFGRDKSRFVKLKRSENMNTCCRASAVKCMYLPEEVTSPARREYDIRCNVTIALQTTTLPIDLKQIARIALRGASDCDRADSENTATNKRALSTIRARDRALLFAR